MILSTFSVVAVSLAGLVLLHVGYLACTRPIRTSASWRASAALLAVSIPAGSWLVWASLEWIPASLRVGAVCLFLAGCLVYLELRSVLSRGYSLRIMLDLTGRDMGETLERLRFDYGNGVGVRGLLVRRLKTLARLRLVHLDGHQIGPLTPLGRVVAVTGSALRQALRMEGVG